MKSCRQRIVERAFETLRAVPVQESLGGEYRPVKLELNRRVALEEVDLPSNILFEGNELPLNDFATMDLYELGLVLQIAARGSDEVAVEYVNSLRAEAIKALKADWTLGGLVRWLELTDAGDFIGAEVPAQTQGALLAFVVHYATREGDPYTFEAE